VTLSDALALSLNTVAVRVGVEVGPRNIAMTAARLGIQSKLDANASISLGTSAVVPMEMVKAYTSFANGGLSVEPYVITEVISRNGDSIYARNEQPTRRVIDPEIVTELNGMMREVILNGTAKRAESSGMGTSPEKQERVRISVTLGSVGYSKFACHGRLAWK